MNTAKIFWTGRSQAVRLPKEFRISGSSVRIRRRGATIVLEPIPRDWSWLDSLSGQLDADAQSGALEKPPAQKRPSLDKLFKS